MIEKFDLSKFDNAKKYEIQYLDISEAVNSAFVKEFRKSHNMTQVVLANLLGVKKKTIEKWEQGRNKISGSSSVLIYLLNQNPDLIKQIYVIERVGFESVKEEPEFIRESSANLDIPEFELNQNYDFNNYAVANAPLLATAQ